MVSSVAFSIAVLAGYGFHAYKSRESHIARAETSLRSVTRALEHHAKWSFAAADLLLRRVASQGETFLKAPEGRDDLHRILAERVMASSILQSIVVLDDRGRNVADSLSFPPRELDGSETDYFSAHRAGKPDKVFITNTFRSRISGRIIFGMSRAIRDEDGNLEGVVFATIDADFFRNLYESLNLGYRATTTLLTSNGDVLMRVPHMAELVGINTANAPLFTKHLPRAPEGTYSVQSIYDKSNRLAAYKKLPDFPLVVTASYSMDDVLYDWRIDIFIEGIFAVSLSLGSVFACYLITRRGKAQ